MNTEDQMFIHQIKVGPMQNYSYLIGDRVSKEVAIVDPAWDIPLIEKIIKDENLIIKAVLLTHGHYDHSDGANDIVSAYDVPVYISEHEAEFYLPACQNLSRTKDRQKIMIGRLEITCIWTPGHTPGCQCFYVPGHLLTGDTLFVHGCGRCDLPGGDPEKMYNTLYQVIAQLPDDTRIYPGHAYGRESSALLKDQKATNPYLTCKDKNDFLTQRMGR